MVSGPVDDHCLLLLQVCGHEMKVLLGRTVSLGPRFTFTRVTNSTLLITFFYLFHHNLILGSIIFVNRYDCVYLIIYLLYTLICLETSSF